VTSDAPAPPTETVDLDGPPETPEELTLASAFPPATREQWATLVAGVIDKSGAKGLTPADAEAKLAVTVGGIRIDGIYGRDRADAPDPGLPGAAPFVRGRLPQGTLGGWDVRAFFNDPRAAATREQVLVDLENGVTSVWLALGAAGVPVTDLGVALTDVLLDLAPVVLDAGAEAIPAAVAFLAVAAERGVQVGSLSGNLGLDPIGLAVRTGEAPELTASAGYVKQFVDTHGAGLPLRTIVVDATAVHDGGASEAQELGYSIAAGVAYLRALAEVGLSASEAAGQLEFRYAATDDQFLTIAKLRAARKLWSRIASACGVPDAEQGQLQHAVTSWPMMTRLDPYVNMLRTTVAAFAAGVGGADAVTVLPFDSAIGLPETLGRRIARNTQALLLDESHIATVIDPAGGSWYVESLTEQLAQAGWAEFQAIEASGGIGHALADGSLINRIHANRAERIRKLAVREDAITGVSEFPQLDEQVLPRQMAPEPVGGGLTRIRWAERHEEMRERVEHFKHVNHRSPTVLLVPLESPRAASVRAGFASDLLSPAGITTAELPEAGESASEATLKAALEGAGTTVACLCGTDPAYGASAAHVADALRAAGATHVLLAGQAKAAPDARIDTFIFRGCDAVAVQEQMLDQLGVAQ
jgi:methylmalonyl-CoA mutase